ncbi:hypothetical protein ABL78_7019 [Leptomonas seymouri]|uniref:Transmembrane protein n=1 Tax=Leptomonas seymouri TaxID=5684 RepID=A0A0N0P3B8_LEPSE|nr:hypothetical protein ABL78_7019 [Leptomonas seymouri]|eukprot:KPI83939.1 hypothetical protein ABL78_7019 [Leptomonas seymouri]
MFRRVTLPLSTTAAFSAFSMAARTAHHKPTTHDWSHIFPQNMSPEASAALKAQSRRTVSAVVPGEMFMRHWIVAEQSTLSVVNRVISGIIAVCTMIWAAGYATLGYNGHNSAHVAGWMFVAYWLVLHTHMMWLLPAGVGMALLQLILN